ncbi:hypothetical protein PMG11_10620 [Penicillium brasilianum]|uniref:Secreted protein CSS2 C-terminal domain-containing protein n=1 Tax=Penicillium brasilianum TaxID=104259 RepID=A0A0F7U359_PENBI|nr:hypothetical protein PMG11_10620 [Penicillium brasilianum]
MVAISKVLPSVLALGLMGLCDAKVNGTTVTYTPKVEQWGEGGNLIVYPDTISADYAHLYEDSLEKRTGITVKAASAKILATSAAVIQTAGAAFTIYSVIASLSKEKSNQNSCTLVYGTDTTGSISEGYAYKATTTGSNCDTTAETKTILAAVGKCANALNAEGAVTGCCTMNRGGTWHGHLRLSGNPTT